MLDRLALPLALALILAPSCKDTSKGGDAGDGAIPAKRSAGAGAGGLYAADPVYIAQDQQFFFLVWNNTFTANLESLPTSGEVPDEHKPYAGGYYAANDGGTNQVMVDGKSPTQKYDDAFYGGKSTATQWEIDKHASGPEWAGHCNGFSAASSRHQKEPAKSVVRNGVTFAPQDIKALLAEVYMSADYQFLGGNRCDQTEISNINARPDPTVRSDCEGINPGTLHLAVANWIGRMQHNIILDAYPVEQVWNYPLFKYQVVSKTYVTAQQAAQAVNGGSTYSWNPAAVKFAQVHMKLTYAEALRKEVLQQFYTKDMDLNYILEVDGNGDVVGGEWTSDTQQFFPGFLWVALEPQQPNGTQFMGNQYIDANTVISMWAESIGADPNNPPIDIKRPVAPSDWGKYATFSVVLDGQQTGAAFAGKQMVLHVTRAAGGGLDGGGIELDLTNNSTAVKSVTSTGSEDFTIAFDTGIGLNLLDFSWKKSGQVVEDETLRFHVMR